jgi:tetratricopeptide (TPR) repeat protein
MATEMPEKAKGLCFVVMGFGRKTDFETGRILDLDKSYRNMIKPAVEAAGLKCIRADEIVHSGLIDVPMYEQLLNADVVVADLSTSNKNAFYELGVRHALRPFTTVVIAEDGIKTFPFDVNHVAVQRYHHLGEDIGYEEVMRFRQLLTKAIIQILQKNPRPKDSPIYTLLNELNPPAIVARQEAADKIIRSGKEIERGLKEETVFSGKPDSASGATPETAPTHSELMQQVDEAEKNGKFLAAKNLLSPVHERMRQESPARPEDPYIIQRLAFATYKSQDPNPTQALEEARSLLELLNPETSNDVATVGIWGAVHRGLWDETGDQKHLDKAVRAYERGFYLRNDIYNGINLALLLNVRAASQIEPAEAIADFVQAQRIRKEIIAICELLREDNNLLENDNYWMLAARAEAYLGIGDEVRGQQLLLEAYSVVPAQWMRESTQKQIAKLQPLLADSPLKHLRTDVARS